LQLLTLRADPVFSAKLHTRGNRNRNSGF